MFRFETNKTYFMSLSVLPDFNNIPDDILDFLKFLKSKNLVKFRSEWKTIVLNIHEKYSSLLTKNILLNN